MLKRRPKKRAADGTPPNDYEKEMEHKNTNEDEKGKIFLK